jgi:hypothetical protein
MPTVGRKVALSRFQPREAPGLVQQEILDDEFALAPGKRRAAASAGNLAINGLGAGVDFDDVIKRIAVRATELSGRHETPHADSRSLAWIAGLESQA